MSRRSLHGHDGGSPVVRAGAPREGAVAAATVVLVPHPAITAPTSRSAEQSTELEQPRRRLSVHIRILPGRGGSVERRDEHRWTTCCTPSPHPVRVSPPTAGPVPGIGGPMLSRCLTDPRARCGPTTCD